MRSIFPAFLFLLSCEATTPGCFWTSSDHAVTVHQEKDFHLVVLCNGSYPKYPSSIPNVTSITVATFDVKSIIRVNPTTTKGSVDLFPQPTNDQAPLYSIRVLASTSLGKVIPYDFNLTVTPSGDSRAEWEDFPDPNVSFDLKPGSSANFSVIRKVSTTNTDISFKPVYYSALTVSKTGGSNSESPESGFVVPSEWLEALNFQEFQNNTECESAGKSLRCKSVLTPSLNLDKYSYINLTIWIYPSDPVWSSLAYTNSLPMEPSNSTHSLWIELGSRSPGGGGGGATGGDGGGGGPDEPFWQSTLGIVMLSLAGILVVGGVGFVVLRFRKKSQREKKTDILQNPSKGYQAMSQ